MDYVKKIQICTNYNVTTWISQHKSWVLSMLYMSDKSIVRAKVKPNYFSVMKTT